MNDIFFIVIVINCMNKNSDLQFIKKFFTVVYKYLSSMVA